MIPSNIGTELLNIAFTMFKRENETARQQEYLELSAFYFRIKNEMEKVIKKYFDKKPFSKKTLDDMFWFHDDVITKIISRKTAGTLTLNPIIDYKEDDDTLDNFLYSINFWETIKEVYKRSKYFNTVILHPVYDTDTKKVRLDILQGDVCTVKSKKDYLLIDEILIARVDENQELYFSFWSEEEHYIVDATGKKITLETNPDGVNPFKEKYNAIPFSIYRDKIGWDFWGEVNIALFTYQMLHTVKVSDNERGEFYYKFPIAISKNIPMTSADILSPGYVLRVDNANPSAQISLEFIQTGTDWGQIRDNEKARRESFMVNQQMPSSSAEIETTVLSGYAKNLDEIELVETKEEDKSNLLRFIYDAIEKTVMVASYYGALKGNYDDIKTELNISFQELKPYESEQDKWLRRENEKKFGMKDEIDFIMEDENCSEEEAIEILNERRERRATLQLEDNTQAEPNLNNLFNIPAEQETQPTEEEQPETE